MQNELGICKTVDPWAGSYYVESLTDELIKKAIIHIDEINRAGGMRKAIEKGIPKMRIEQSAAKKQAKIDNYEQVIVGVNKYKIKFQDEISLLEIDNELVYNKQINRIKKLKKNRNDDDVKKILDEIKLCAKNNNKNLLALAVEAAKKRATLGEISFAIEEVYGRYQPKIKSLSGVYKSKMKKNKLFDKAIKLSDNFSEIQGRRPRILIAKVGQDGHDRGAKVIASSFADMGFDVDIGPLFQSPDEVVKQAVENDVHIIGISSLAGGHKTLIKELFIELNKYKSNEIMVVIGGIIPKADHEFLNNLGISAIFGPGSNIIEIAIQLLHLLITKK
tara:strand:- start:1235 stop:2233 length:999 start_codon:yes stop_codon:yes gene_type:complete